LARGRDHQAAQGSQRALHGEQARRAQQGDEDPGQELPGRGLGALVVDFAAAKRRELNPRRLLGQRGLGRGQRAVEERGAGRLVGERSRRLDPLDAIARHQQRAGHGAHGAATSCCTASPTLLVGAVLSVSSACCPASRPAAVSPSLKPAGITSMPPTSLPASRSSASWRGYDFRPDRFRRGEGGQKSGGALAAVLIDDGHVDAVVAIGPGTPPPSR
jgi:hypothetical protein